MKKICKNCKFYSETLESCGNIGVINQIWFLGEYTAIHVEPNFGCIYFISKDNEKGM